ALAIDNIEGYDLVVTDLDVTPRDGSVDNGHQPVCLPEHIIAGVAEHVKAFKICAANFRRAEFDEEELKKLVATILDYKTRYVDTIDTVQDLHENIQFEL